MLKLICHRECPADLKEGIASLIFAAPRCCEIPELMTVRNFFERKYGRDFVSAASDLRPDCGVNGMVSMHGLHVTPFLSINLFYLLCFQFIF